MMFQSLARKRLFGTQQNTVTMRSVTVSALGNAGRAALGRPLVDTGIGELLRRGVERLLGVRIAKTMDERLPQGWPADIYRVVAQEIESKAGSVKLEDGVTIPAFRLTAKGAAVLPFAWVAMIKPSSKFSDYKKALGLDDSIREALAQKGHKLTVRIMPFPLRVEVDRTDAQLVSLAEDWQLLKSQKQNEFEYVLGVHYDGGLQLGINCLCDSREFSGIVAGASGSGKSQWAMAMLLSAALNTSPELLSMVICDPKHVDFSPFAPVPHLAHSGILTEVDDCRGAIAAVLAEMDRRVKVGNRAVMRQRILLYIDELPDLLDQDDGTIEAALIRLSQKGRAWGINVFVAAQKATSDVISTRTLANLAVRVALRVGSYHESNHVSGQDGCQAHKLPGNGSALIYNAEYNGGLRSQTHFVADADKPDFDRVVGAFADDIRERWSGCRPHWRLVAPVENDSEAVESNSSVGRPPVQFDQVFIIAVARESTKLGIDFKINTISRLYQSMYGKRLNHDRAKQLFEDMHKTTK